MQERDNIFNKNIDKKFEFDETVAAVFDDMLSRSVPYYNEVIDLIVSLILSREEDGLRVLDLGSSTAKLLLELHNRATKDIKLTGIDNSKAMIERATAKCKAFGANITLIEGDILEHNIENEDIIVSNYTLQFIRPIKRPKLVKKIYDGLRANGEFYFSEKVVFEDKRLDKVMIDIYYDYKRKQGYSEYEISAKREALENVLIPFTIDENIEMCKSAGFKQIDTIFQWANFVTFRAVK